MRWLTIAFFFFAFTAKCPAQTDPAISPQKQSIHGKVIDAKSGEPIRKVSVQVSGVSGDVPGKRFAPYSATTNSDGTFSMSNLSPGRYAVMLQRSGFVQVIGRREGMFALRSGQSVTELTFKMEAAGVISGRIVDGDGDPIAAVNVNAMLPGSMPSTGVTGSYGSGTTNDLGEYRIPDLRPGKYLVLAQPGQRSPVVRADSNGQTKERMVYASTFFPGTADQSRAIAVEVRGGQDAAANFGALLTHVYRVSGTVAGVPSEAMVTLELMSRSGSEGIDGPQRLRLNDHFEYQNVLPGSYTAVMFVFKGSYGGQHDMYTVRLTPPIEVDNTDITGLQLQPEPLGQIHGKFRLDAEGQFDWTQLNINLSPISENESDTLAVESGSYILSQSNAVVKPDGSFELKNVPEGSYQLVVRTQSGNLRDYYTKAVNLSGRNVTDSGFAVRGDSILDVVISPKGATIDGTVVDSKSQPASYATVVIVPNSEHRGRPDSYQLETADERGHFAAQGLNPGTFVVLAFEDLKEDTRQPEFLRKYGDKGEKVDLDEGKRKSLTARVIPAEP